MVSGVFVGDDWSVSRKHMRGSITHSMGNIMGLRTLELEGSTKLLALWKWANPWESCWTQCSKLWRICSEIKYVFPDMIMMLMQQSCAQWKCSCSAFQNLSFHWEPLGNYKAELWEVMQGFQWSSTLGRTRGGLRRSYVYWVDAQENGCCTQKQGRTNKILITDYIVVNICFISSELLFPLCLCIIQ